MTGRELTEEGIEDEAPGFSAEEMEALRALGKSSLTVAIWFLEEQQLLSPRAVKLLSILTMEPPCRDVPAAPKLHPAAEQDGARGNSRSPSLESVLSQTLGGVGPFASRRP